ncbi:MAG: hypothetical protein AB1Z18_01845, partial [Desulfobacterales bacterium]
GFVNDDRIRTLGFIRLHHVLPIFKIDTYRDGKYLVPIHGFIKGTGKFPIQKCAIFCKFK